MRRTRVMAAAVAAVALAGCVSQGASPAAQPPAPKPRPISVRPFNRCHGCRYVGMAAVPLHELPSVEASTGVKDSIVEVYTTFGSMASVPEIAEIAARQAVPFVQLLPYKTPMAAIAAGDDDGYLRSLAQALHKTDSPVALSFAPEANGSWYQWGCGHTSAPVYLRAWHHLHQIMGAAGAHNIIWVWDINDDFTGGCTLVSRWPGSHYVNWVGIDGYWRQPGDTFSTVLKPTIDEVRHFTHDRVLIAETGAPDVPEAAQWITSLFAGVEQTPGLIGLVYFDHASKHGDYVLAHDAKAQAAFSTQAEQYLTQPSG